MVGRSSADRTPGLVTLELGMSNTYLLPSRGGYLQVDTGYGWTYPDYLRALARRGIELDEIDWLFLTHHHDDHAGFLNQLTRDTEVTVIAHAAAEPLLASGANDTSRGGGYVTRRVKLLADIKMRLDRRWTLTFDPFVLRAHDRRIDHDDDALLPSIGIAGRILTTPGHTIDHLTLLLDDGSAFCGDATANMLRLAGTRHCTVFMTDMEQSYDSWRKLLAAGATTIYPAHGRPFPAEDLIGDLDAITTEQLVPFF